MHKLRIHPAAPGRVYQQNHVGVYRSDDYGDNWYAIHKGLPYDFGFGMTINQNDPETCYVVPIEPMEYSFRATAGKFRVYQSSAKGKSWRELGRGLPDQGAYLNVLREGVSSDTLKPCGVYVGTGTGHIFHSPDEGRSWKTMANYLPPIMSISAAVI